MPHQYFIAKSIKLTKPKKLSSHTINFPKTRYHNANVRIRANYQKQ